VKLLLRDYLSLLRERGELDALLPDLLTQMGLTVTKVARRGESEQGKDIVAIKQKDDQREVWILVVQQGDLTENRWQGPGAMRMDAESALDVAFEDQSVGITRDTPRRIILVHNGTVGETIRERVDGFCKEAKEKRGVEIDRWDLSGLCNLFHEHLVGERLLAEPGLQHLLRATLVFLDVPEYDLKHFKDLVNAILPKSEAREHAVQQAFRTLRLVLRMVHAYAREAGNLTPAVVAHEYALLRIWHWMLSEKLLTSMCKKEIGLTLREYVGVAVAYVQKIDPWLRRRYGLALGGPSAIVEYPLRTFSVLGHLSGLLLLCGPGDATIRQWLHDRLLSTIINNPASKRPLLDDHSIEIALVAIALLSSDDRESARGWVREQIDRMVFRKQIGRRLPELNNNLEAVLELEATGKAPFFYEDSSSCLMYILMELTLLTDDKETYEEYAPHFRETGVDLQLWYPPDDVESELFGQEVTRGTTETSIPLPDSFEVFVEEVKERHQRFDILQLRTLQEGWGFFVYLACKHFRTPLPPTMWRCLIPPVTEGPRTSGNQTESRAPGDHGGRAV
jgi:hypothetical protein